jgi:hypothetical protein
VDRRREAVEVTDAVDVIEGIEPPAIHTVVPGPVLGGGGRQGASIGVGDLRGRGLGGLGELGQGGGIGSIRGSRGAPSSGVSPSLGEGSLQISGRLPPEIIRRVVRQHLGRLRFCYERALKASPALAGRVAVSFVIDRSGAVASATDAGSTLPSAEVVSCVVTSFSQLSFPRPEGGTVSVVYPLVFSPGAP